jgi:hypothetical protein
MAVELNHTIVPAHDPRVSAQFLAGIPGLPVDPPLAHFTPVTLANGVSLDFDHYEHVDEPPHGDPHPSLRRAGLTRSAARSP